jgi:DNA-binding transcriptional MerR regulator
VNDRTELSPETTTFTIGQLSERTALPVRTIRYWSDIGLVPPTSRSPGGYRLYDSEAVARLDLVRTLRELGLDLRTVREVLDRRTGTEIGDVAREHVRALDAEIRALKLRRAVLSSVAKRHGTTEETLIMHKLAQLSAEERQRIIDDFVDSAFEGVDTEGPGAHIAQGMRIMPAELPDDPSAEQVDAWVELAELVGDDDFRRRVREMAVTGASPGAAPTAYDPAVVIEHAGAAVESGVPPESEEGRTVLRRILADDLDGDERARLADQVALFTDRRVERYWQLAGVLNGREPFPARVPAFEWFIEALRARR